VLDMALLSETRDHKCFTISEMALTGMS